MQPRPKGFRVRRGIVLKFSDDSGKYWGSRVVSIALHPVLSKAILEPSSAEAVVAMAQAEPTVIWMGVTAQYDITYYHRLWSDGRMEARNSGLFSPYGSPCFQPAVCEPTNWIEVPPPPAGNGFACRSDVNGDRRVDGADLASLLGNWGENMACEPEPTYPCLGFGGGLQ